MPEDNLNRTDDSIKLVALVVASIASFFTPFMGTSVNLALPAIGANFGADAILLNLSLIHI